ncbi:MAG: SIS domain-containing protein [Pseudomonadota bacterium]
MSPSLLDLIDQRTEHLTPAEARVAQWISANPRGAAELPIARLADAAGVSEPTVVRFCRSLGLSGFRELRTQLGVALQSPDSFAHQDVAASDSLDAAASKVLDNAVRALVGASNASRDLPFAAAAELLAAARQIVFVGLGASGLVARDAEHKFFRLGIPCSTASDVPTIAQRAATACAGDVYLAISYTGEWRDLVMAMELARDNGACVISVTDPEAGLARAARLTFASLPVENTSVYTPMSSRLVQLALLDALQVATALALGSSAETNLRRAKDALLMYRPA